MKRLITLTAAAALLGSVAFAGPVADFEKDFRAMYSAYRTALFGTNAGKQDVSADSAAKLQDQLHMMIVSFGETPPPQYEDDPMWLETMTKAAATVETAQAQITEGTLTEAHETLEAVRDLFGELHRRNGVQTFSDRMNAYHAEMEDLLAMDVSALDTAGVAKIRDHAAVLNYLAKDLLDNPSTEAEGSDDYSVLSKAFAGSVAALVEAARAGDPEQVKAAVGGLKVPYSKLFLKFG